MCFAYVFIVVHLSRLLHWDNYCFSRKKPGTHSSGQPVSLSIHVHIYEHITLHNAYLLIIQSSKYKYLIYDLYCGILRSSNIDFARCRIPDSINEKGEYPSTTFRAQL